ncbi:unnamed protein product [Urochloa humidicola]
MQISAEGAGPCWRPSAGGSSGDPAGGDPGGGTAPCLGCTVALRHLGKYIPLSSRRSPWRAAESGPPGQCVMHLERWFPASSAPLALLREDDDGTPVDAGILTAISGVAQTRITSNRDFYIDLKFNCWSMQQHFEMPVVQHSAALEISQ